MGEEVERDYVPKKTNLLLKVRLSLEDFLWNSKEEEGELNEIKLSWGAAGGGRHVNEFGELKLRISLP